MGTLLYLVMLVVVFALPPLIARLILSTFFPKFWSHRFVRWGLYSALLCLTYLLSETLSFRGDVDNITSSYSAVITRASWTDLEGLFSAEGAFYNLIRLQHILDCFFPFVVAPALLVAMATYMVDRSQQTIRPES
jgi:hypothetical protein